MDAAVTRHDDCVDLSLRLAVSDPDLHDDDSDRVHQALRAREARQKQKEKLLRKRITQCGRIKVQTARGLLALDSEEPRSGVKCAVEVQSKNSTQRVLLSPPHGNQNSIPNNPANPTADPFSVMQMYHSVPFVSPSWFRGIPTIPSMPPAVEMDKSTSPSESEKCVYELLSMQPSPPAKNLSGSSKDFKKELSCGVMPKKPRKITTPRDVGPQMYVSPSMI